MKVTFTFEYGDLLEQIEKMLSMNGVKALTDDEGNKLITFNQKKKEIVIHCEAAPIPEACPFCNSGVQQDDTEIDDSKTQTIDDDSQTNDDDPSNKVSQANTGDEEENVPMSMAALKAQSRALSSQKGPLKVARGAEAHAELVEPSRLDGETEDPPSPGEGGA